MPQVLIEFFSEEIPARMQERARQDLKSLFTKLLTEHRLSASSVETYVTPRRLVVVAEDVPTVQPSVVDERRGPRVDAPASALDGFLASCGLTSASQCEIRETPKGSFYFALIEKEEQETPQVLKTIVNQLLHGLTWPKSMRWSKGSFTWVRPLHSILCLFKGVPLDLELIIPSVCATTGHRFLSPQPMMANDFESYQNGLRSANVIIDPRERRQRILDMTVRYAQNRALSLVEDDRLLDEVTGLVEWPFVLMGKIEQQFMTLPREILITVMRHHQRYFALTDARGNLAPYFLFVANIIPSDDGAQAIRGNEWVLRARFSDAEFFWEEDLKVSLYDRAKNLPRLVFHHQLGSLGDKVTRIGTIAEKLRQLLFPQIPEDDVKSATLLCKADLTSHLVGEFPELQGVIGYHLAIAQGIPENIAQAIPGHYAPTGADKSPTLDPLSLLIGLADRLDTLACFFSINEQPTGSKDPFALRRAALGVIRTLLENDLQKFSLSAALSLALSCVPVTRTETKGAEAKGTEAKSTAKGHDVSKQLHLFFKERLRVFMKDQGIRHDIIESALIYEDSPAKAFATAKETAGFFDTGGSALLQAYKRASNLLKDARVDPIATPSSYETPEEQTLWEACHQLEEKFKEKTLSIADRLHALSPAAQALDQFVVSTTIHVEDPALKIRRLSPLKKMKTLFDSIIEFSLLEGKS